MLPQDLFNKLQNRINENNLRALDSKTYQYDFFSNDYLGYSKNKSLFDHHEDFIKKHNIDQLGSTGSRLISGNHFLFDLLESKAKDMLNAKSALFYNSGYDANLGLLSAILKPKDIVFFDELCHASIRDGLQMSSAKAYKFKHNNYEDLISKIKLQLQRLKQQTIYIISESVFSMDGDQSDIKRLVDISKQFKAYLIIDEAHALGVCGNDYKGLSFEYSDDIFARIYTCGKSLGTHGGFILGSKTLIDYLINFSRPFIYTTAASPHHVAQVICALDYFESHHKEKEQLQKNISFFRNQTRNKNLDHTISANSTAIQSINISGNTKAKKMAHRLKSLGYGVKAILSPTVPKGQERIRICLHSYNDQSQITSLLKEIEHSHE